MINVYMDFDGCINVSSDGPPKRNTQWFGDWGTAKLEGQPIFWSHDLVEALNDLGMRADVRLVWLTDWQELARDVVAPEIGLHGPWDVLTGDVEQPYPWWKLTALEDDLIQHPADGIVWVDDNLLYDKAASDYVRHKTHILPIHPNSYHGVTKKHFSGIIEFIDGNK